jgi:hypothetical protein
VTDRPPVGYDTTIRRGHLHPTEPDGPMAGKTLSHVHDEAPVGHEHEDGSFGHLGPAQIVEVDW